MSDDLNVIGNAWTPYTPTLSNLTLGNGTISGRYMGAGKFTTFSVSLTFGSTTSITGSNSTMTLPVTAKAGNWISTDCAGYDTSANQWYPLAIVTAGASGGASTTAFLIKLWPTTAGNNIATITSSTPFTWATGDIITVTATYEAA
jgi:hypothetical protein